MKQLGARGQVKQLDKQGLPADELIAALHGCDAVISYLSEKFSQQVISSCPTLKVIANIAVGYDNVDIEAASASSVLVTNTPGVLDETTADLAFGLLLACARRIVEADRLVRAGSWQGWDPDLMLGVDVHGKTIGVVGLGRIGKAVARRGLGFGMKVIYTTKSMARVEQEEQLPGLTLVSLPELLKSADFISLNCPLNKETYHLIGEREFNLVKPGAILINTARGAIIDQQALINALEGGRLGAAGLDVFENEPCVPERLLRNNVVVAPHIGSATIETREAMAELAAGALISALSGQLPPNAVNSEIWPRFLARLSTSSCDQEEKV
jgi:glyoxylate reductase